MSKLKRRRFIQSLSTAFGGSSLLTLAEAAALSPLANIGYGPEVGRLLQQAALARAQSVATLTPSSFFDWAQTQFPTFFPGQPANVFGDTFVYRYYASTQNYIAVAGDTVYVLGPSTQGQLMLVGRLSDFACNVNPATCTVAGSPIVQLTLISNISGSAKPFCFGQAFRKGDVATGQELVSSQGEVQVVSKNRWGDGSLKFGIVSGLASLAANTPLALKLSPGTPTSQAALNTTDLIVKRPVVSLSCGGFGTVTWSDLDWSAPFQNWVSGPIMSSWIYRKAVGQDPHLVAWLEVRLFASGDVEILPWIENGYLQVPNPTSKTASFALDINGTRRFSANIDLPNHCRTPLISGTALSYWLANDPQVSAQHDTAYLQSTGLLPTYRASTPANAGVLTSLPTSYAPLQQSNYPASMGQTGYHGSIGLLPEWDVLYLTSASAKAFNALVINGYSAGRFSIHFRDETTQRPLQMSKYPNLVLGGGSSIGSSGASTRGQFTPTSSGTTAPNWATSHHPSIGYMAYLATGRWYFMEQIQFSAALCYLKNSDDTRLFSQGVFQSAAGANTTRGAAWALRTLAQAACATPDDDRALQGEFINSVQSNVSWNHARYVAQTNNPFGWVAPYNDYTGPGDNLYFEAAWMQDFYTAAFGMLKALELPLSSGTAQQLTEFFAWKAQSVVGRLGGTLGTEYLFADAAQYAIAVAPTDTPDFVKGAGPWHANWGAIYKDTLKTENPGQVAPLRGAYFPDATSYWGNLQPAIAYAVQHGVAGAQTAYLRMTQAPNWPEIVADLNANPVWSVRPGNQA